MGGLTAHVDPRAWLVARKESAMRGRNRPGRRSPVVWWGILVLIAAMIGMTPRIVAAGVVVVGSTSQDWDFATGGINLNNPIPPDVFDNPFGNPTLAPLGSGVIGDAFGRTGVLTLLDHSAVFTIPNADDEHQKVVKVEIQYRFTNPNQVLGTAALVGGGGEAFQKNIPVDKKLADGWHFQTINWTRGTCPISEILTIPRSGRTIRSTWTR
jgi:hypothetical protein